jgi:hypothetical protein
VAMPANLTLLLLCGSMAIPLLTDSPSVSTTYLGRVAMPANLTLLLLCGSMAIPLLTDSPSVSTTYLGRVAMPANLTYYYSEWIVLY